MASTREEMTGFTLNQQPSTISGEAHPLLTGHLD